MILNRRLKRNFKTNLVRYTGLSFVIIFGMAIVIALAASTDSISKTVSLAQKNGILEDGDFTVYSPLTDKNLKDLYLKGIDVEENFYTDIKTENNKTLRIFKVREKFNLIQLTKGHLPTSKGEIFLEKNFALKNSFKIGDNIKLNNTNFIISGTGTTPDYNTVLLSEADAIADTKNKSIAFVTNNDFTTISNDKNTVIHFNYSYKLSNEATNNELRDYLLNLKFDNSLITDTYIQKKLNKVNDIKTDFSKGINNLLDLNSYIGNNILMKNGLSELNSNISDYLDETLALDFPNLSSFQPITDTNNRVHGAPIDSKIYKTTALISGIIISILIGYMLSVFSTHEINKESPIIGTLYSLGYVKKDLIRHFITLPIIVVSTSSIIGTLLGFVLIAPLAQSNVDYFSYPPIEYVYNPLLIVYGIIVPITFTILINYYMLNKRLSIEPLKLLRKTKNSVRLKEFNLNKLNFINKYRIRQNIREMRTNISLFFGLFVSILLMVFAIAIQGSTINYVNSVTNDVNFKNLYTLRNPLEKQPKDTEVGYFESFETNFKITDTDLDVVLQGIEKNSKFFEFSNNLKANKNSIYISSSAAEKFGYKKGDEVVFTNPIEEKSYVFTIEDDVPFGSGLYFFMNIDAMREFFEKEDDYYNTLFSNSDISINSNMLISTTSYDDMVSAAKITSDMMYEMIILMVSISVILFIIVMYLLLKMTIERSTFSISLIKVFGFNNKEIKKLYLGSSFYIVTFTAIVAIPTSKFIVDILYPYMISNFSSGMDCVIQPVYYVLIVILILICYFITNLLLQRHLNKVSLVEILKDRE